MIGTCLINATTDCSRLDDIYSIKKSVNEVQLAYAFDWGTITDTPELIYDLYLHDLIPLAEKIGLNLKFQRLGGKQTGSIYCDICCEIQKSDIILFDISSHNINVLFELGLAIGSGTYIYLLRSKHQKKPVKSFSDLSGILEYRFTKTSGKLSFEKNLIGDINSKLNIIANNRIKTSQ